MAVIGAFEVDEREIEAGELQIAAINGAIITYAERQVYARDSDFLYAVRQGEKIGRGDSLWGDPVFVRPRSAGKKRRRESMCCNYNVMRCLKDQWKGLTVG